MKCIDKEGDYVEKDVYNKCFFSSLGYGLFMYLDVFGLVSFV